MERTYFGNMRLFSHLAVSRAKIAYSALTRSLAILDLRRARFVAVTVDGAKSIDDDLRLMLPPYHHRSNETKKWTHGSWYMIHGFGNDHACRQGDPDDQKP